MIAQCHISPNSVLTRFVAHGSLSRRRYTGQDEPTRAEGSAVTDAPGAECDEEGPECRRVVLFLRLVLDGRAHLLRGELFDIEATNLAKFASFAGLVEAIRHWLDQQRDVAP